MYAKLLLTLMVSMYALAYFSHSSTLSLFCSISSRSFCNGTQKLDPDVKQFKVFARKTLPSPE